MKEETKRKISETNRLKLPEDIVVEIYLMGFPGKEVADMFHCSLTAIQRVLNDKGVMRTLSEITSGANNPMYGSHRTGKENPNWGGGKPHCIDCGKELVLRTAKRCRECFEKTQKGEGHPFYGLKGENNPLWKGGRSMSWTRHNGKRRDMGFIPLNKPFPGSEGHHLDADYVLYIPDELHHNTYHNLTTGQGMEEINDLAIEFEMERLWEEKYN